MSGYPDGCTQAMHDAHYGPNYGPNPNPDGSYEMARDYALTMTPNELLRARLHRLVQEAGHLIGALIECRDGNLSAIQANEDNVRIIESEFAFARRAIERMLAP